MRVESLECRMLLSASGEAFPAVMSALSHVPRPDGNTPSVVSPPSGVTTPAQLRKAYGIDQIQVGPIVGDGTGQTIVIIDAYDNPKFVSSTDPNFATSDLHMFDLAYGLADPPSFLKLDQSGGTNYPGQGPGPSSNGSWQGEEAMDVEWAHVIAPKANLVLVECNDNFNSNLLSAGVVTAAKVSGASAVSMSFGGGDYSGETSYDSLFRTPSNHQGVTFLASTGDSGVPGGYPSWSPNVVAVGGTSLFHTNGTYQSESGWSGSGGGQSAFESEPNFQNSVQSSGKRQTPDISFLADPGQIGVAVYDSYDNGTSNPWGGFSWGGTSLSCPCWAGLVAITDQLRVANGKTTFDGSTQFLPALYGLPKSDFHDVTTGNNGKAAGAGYDMVTGIGSPIANLLVADLVGSATNGPVVSSVTPNSGPSAGGTSVTIVGTNLTGVTAVKFGTQAATIKSTTATTIVATSPVGSGVVDVTVTTPAGTSATSASDHFTYVSPPVVSGLSPASGPAAGGNTVFIAGSGFTGATSIKFGSKNLKIGSFTVVSDAQIQLIAPAGKAGVATVTVTVGKFSGSGSYTYIPTPVVSKVAVVASKTASGSTLGGTVVTITGSGFTNLSAVYFGTTAATSFHFVSDTTITAVSPAHAAGKVDITVVTPGGTSKIASKDAFTYVAPAAVALDLATLADIADAQAKKLAMMG